MFCPMFRKSSLLWRVNQFSPEATRIHRRVCCHYCCAGDAVTRERCHPFVVLVRVGVFNPTSDRSKVIPSSTGDVPCAVDSRRSAVLSVVLSSGVYPRGCFRTLVRCPCFTFLWRCWLHVVGEWLCVCLREAGHCIFPLHPVKSLVRWCALKELWEFEWC